MHISSKYSYVSCMWLLPAVLASKPPEPYIIQSPTTFCPLEPFGTGYISGVCPVDRLGNEANETSRLPADKWIKGDLCHEVPGSSEARYCTFTHPAFNHGFGISIITTLDTFERISALPVFHKIHAIPDAEEAGPAPRPPYKDVSVPGKGIGLVVTDRPVEPNEIYMVRTPAVMLDDTAFQQLGRSRLTELLTRAVGDLPRAHQAEYLNLTTHEEVKTHADRVYQIFMRNNFRTEIQNVEVFHSAFTQVSRLNHACRPNSDYFFDDSTLTHNIFAARRIPLGEELTVTYSDPIQTQINRYMYLLHHWGFECTCSLCTAPPADVAASDARIEQIQNLWADLDDYTASGAGTPEKAERLVQLYREEGLVTRMVEAYYRAAVEWNGLGDAEKARGFAERAVRAGEIMESGIRPFMGTMRDMVRSPEEHWTWRFRVRNQE